jgi:hypothetical protein
MLDLYARQGKSQALKSAKFVISAEEKTSIQARIRKHPSGLRAPNRARVRSRGAWA